MIRQPAPHTSHYKMIHHGFGCAVWALMVVVTWRAVVVGGDLPPHLASLQPKGRAIDTHSYYSYNKFAHKACHVTGYEGVCMFVWECIKTEGNHVGMCMDGFMFGSCCTHDKVNQVSQASTGDVQIVPGITSKNSSLLLPTSSTTTPPPETSATTGVASFITSKPINIERPSYTPTTTTTTTPTKERHTSPSPPLISSPAWSRLPPLTVTSPQSLTSPTPVTLPYPGTSPRPVTPPKPPTRPTRPPKPTKPTRATLAPWWTTTKIISTTLYPEPSHKTTPPSSSPSTVSTTTPTTTTTTTTTTTPSTTTTRRTTTTRPTTTTTTTTTTITTSTTPRAGPVVSSAHTKHQCGVTNMRPQPEGRIVNGTNSKFGEWPWQVSVRRTSFFGFSSTHRCGGALLNEQWAATAGHCVDDLLTSQIRIRVGEYDFTSVLEPHPYVERAVKQKAVHPKYNFFTYEYDLALVQTEKPIVFMPHISPICLPGNNDLLIGETATVTGWGRLSEHGRLPSVLQKASVPIVSNSKCKDMFLQGGRREHIPDIFLCAGYEKGGIDSCQGDSGGPLQVRGADGRYFLAGIISWGIGCGEPNLPGVCTRISKFVPWILEKVT